MSAETEPKYELILDGGREHGGFEIVPPTTDEHYAALMEEPRLSRPNDFYLERGEDRDSFLFGHYFKNGSGYGEHYNRARYFTGVVSEVLRKNGAFVSVINDKNFELRSTQRLRQLQEANTRF